MQKPDPTKGILWFLMSRFSFALSASMVKFFPYSAFQFNLLRGLFTLTTLGPYLYKTKGIQAFHVKRPFFMATRLLVGVSGLICYYYTFQLMDLAKAVTIAATQTFLTPLLAKFFLDEKVGAHRWLAISIGYVGVWFALDPVHTGIEFPEWIAIAHVLLSASSNIMTKKILREETAETTMFYGGVTSIVVVPIVWLITSHWGAFWGMEPWPMMTIGMFLMLFFLFGPTGFLGQYGYMKSFTYADLSLLMPYEYSSFVFAAVIGYVGFGEVPATTTWIAMVCIILATTILASMEAHRHRRIKKSAET